MAAAGADPILAALLFLYRELLEWEWSWQWVFPNEIAGRTRPREKKAVECAGLSKPTSCHTFRHGGDCL
jgi:hypothetical protein